MKNWKRPVDALPTKTGYYYDHRDQIGIPLSGNEQISNLVLLLIKLDISKKGVIDVSPLF